MTQSFQQKTFYHMFPLGLCGSPQHNDSTSLPVSRLNEIYNWIPHLVDIGITDLYLGPLFESESHGYDTTDYRKVDRRLGTWGDLKNLVTSLHNANIKVTLDTVFNHTGRSFFAFQDIMEHRENSRYTNWYAELSFDHKGHYGDGITYKGWAENYNLVKLNLKNMEVQNYLLETLTLWIKELDIDGLRLDAANVMDKDFLSTLTQHCTHLKPNFFVFGEVVHGNYADWAHQNCLHSVTNYEVYKGLWSSHKDQNLFEIAWTLNRQFGKDGIYKNIPLYNFVDNHDVNRLCSNLTKKSDLHTVYGLLFTIPGVPSIYYGSESGIEGTKAQTDWPLRPALQVSELSRTNPELQDTIRRLSFLRKNAPALLYGSYEQISVTNQQLLFRRKSDTQDLLIAINIAEEPIDINIPTGNYRDILNKETVNGYKTTLYPNWLRILQL